MESFKFNKVTQDLRQSENWKEYLKWLGWNCIRTSKGTSIAIRKTPIGALTKIQRPRNLDEQELKEIEQICLKHKAMFIKIEPGLAQNLDLLESRGYRENKHPFIPPSTSIIDLTLSEENLWKNLSKSGKYSVKRARRDGAKVTYYKNPQKKEIVHFHRLMAETSKEKKLISTKLEDLQKKVALFKENSDLVLVKDGNDKLMAGNLYFGVEKTTWYLHGATAHAGRKGNWGYELMWQSILYFKKEGYTVLELEGIDDDRFPSFTKTWGGFSYFKEKFGGKKIKFPAPYMKVLNPLLKFFERVYGTLPL